MGVNKKILYVDLSKSKVRDVEVGEEIFKMYLGGRGLGARIFLDSGRVNEDPFSPDSLLILAVGPLTGTPIPMNSRVHLVFRSPLTNGWGESSMGGSFPSFLKWAGYDGVIITGKSREPTYLHISPESSKLHSAKDLWGLDAYEAEKELVDRCGGSRYCRAVVIGPAGENLVKYATITHGSLELKIGRGGQAGRCGAGAIFGSKKLKGIVVSIESREVKVHDPEKTRDIAREVARELKEKGKRLREYGTASMIDIGNAMKFLPTRYWTYTSYDKISQINSSRLREEYLVGIAACTSCPVACGRITKTEFAGEELMLEGPEYETLYALGPLLGSESIRDVMVINDYADKLGLDTITLGNILSFAKVLCEEKKVEGLKLETLDSYLELVESIAFKRGRLGEILGEGVLKAAELLKAVERAVHVRGLEPPGYDPRGLYSMYIAYATSPRGACHLRTMAYIIDIRGIRGDQNTLSRSKIEAIVEWEDWCSLFDSMTLCKFGRDVYNFERMAQALASVTGWEVTGDNIREIGRRITTLVHYIERNKMGRGREYDRVPPTLAKPARDGRASIGGSVLEEYLRVYYEVRGFDVEGRVSKNTLEYLKISLGKEVLLD